MLVSGNRIVMWALACASWAFPTVEAAPAKSIKIDVETGAIDPAGAVPFDQWITATSSVPIALVAGKQLIADLEYCGASQRTCPSAHPAPPACAGPGPVIASCEPRIDVTASADKKTALVRVNIPPLRYNRAYELSVAERKEIPLSDDLLMEVSRSLDAYAEKLANSNKSPTAPEICSSIVAVVRSQLRSSSVRIEPLASCAESRMSLAEIEAVESSIAASINAKLTLMEASRNSDPQATSEAETRHTRARQELFDQVVRVMTEVQPWARIPLGTAADAATTRKSYISMDAGLVYGWDLDESITYFGANIYTRPINTDVSLASLKAEGLLTWRHRLSFTLGATIESIEKAGQRKGIIGSNALVVGVGWRLTDVIRISAGALVFEEENPNPLVTNDASLAVSPYVGLSFDIDVAKQLGKIFTGLP